MPANCTATTTAIAAADSPVRLRKRAERMRAIAQEYATEDTLSQAALALAEEYDRLAGRDERQDRGGVAAH